jgi:TRAP-type C4-dicarboxylate transport system permease small subunit
MGLAWASVPERHLRETKSCLGMSRIGTRLLIESARLVFALLIRWAGAQVLQRPIERTCAQSEANPAGPSGLCAGLSGLYGAILGFAGAILLSVIVERLWRRRRDPQLGNGTAKPS